MRVGIALALSLLIALPATAGRYETDHDHDIDFSSYESFAWVDVEPADASERIARSDLVMKRMRRALSSGLEEKGLRQADAGKADLRVEFRVHVRERVDLDDTRFGRSSRDIFIDSYVAGTAIIDLIDQDSERLVWRGWIKDLVREGPTTKQQIERAVTKLLRDYPPKRD